MNFEATDTLPPTCKFIIKGLIPAGRLKILDLGCGVGACGTLLNKGKKHKLIGIDIYKPYLDICRRKGYYQRLINADLTKINFKPKSFDFVILSQVIEHLKKDDAVTLIKKSQDIAKKAVLVSVPNGPCHQGMYDNNKHQKHKSEWTERDLRELGFKVYGQGFKVIYGSKSYEGRRKAKLWQKIAVIFSVFLFPAILFFPRLGAQLIAISYNDN